MFSSATQPPRPPPPPPPPRHNFVVSAITFEVFKLRSIIDIVVPSEMAAGGHFVKNYKKKIKIRMDLKWPEMPSKVNFGHRKWPINQKWPEHPTCPPVAIL